MSVARPCFFLVRLTLQGISAIALGAFGRTRLPNTACAILSYRLSHSRRQPQMGVVSMYRSRFGRRPTSLLLQPAPLLLVIFLALLTGAPGAQQDDLWSEVKSGSLIVVMRHAEAPGIGDPDNFTLGDCRTQRNLSAAGIEQATRIGDRFRDQGITRARVFSSQWCRCRETGEALALGPVVELPALNSFFRDFSREESQTRALRQWISAQPKDGPLILVTHQVNITALTGVFPASGELLVVGMGEAGEVTVARRIRTD